jgi:hypothetical protein
MNSSAGSEFIDGITILQNPWTNKGRSFTKNEQPALHLEGLLPLGEPLSLDTKVDLAMKQLRKKTSNMDKYLLFQLIEDSDKTLFYATFMKYLIEGMEIMYTPTVGEACLEWSQIYRQTSRGKTAI